MIFSRASPHFRWFICGLLFYATTVNYMDRTVLGILKPVIGRELHWTETQYGLINSAFQLGYALTMPIAGWLIDRFGIRIGYSAAALVWSLASMSHAFAGSVLQFSAARLVLGLGEAANFPAAIKTVADWFARGQRALATGILNSGSNLGAIIAPLVVPFLARRFGWHSGFLFTGSLSMSWTIVWFLIYREPSKMFRSDAPHASVDHIPYRSLLKGRATWAVVLGKGLTDPVWYFYLFWLPGFLQTNYHVDLVNIGPPLVAIYLSADIGSIGGGWLSSALLNRGWPVERARKGVMLIFAVCVLAVAFVPKTAGNLWATVMLVSIAAASHQGWSANMYTIASDCFPRSVVASIIGLAGLFGALGGMFAHTAIGIWLDFSKEAYGPLFVIAGLMYSVALLLIHILMPRDRWTTGAA
ncbi:MAG: MFS transporter [Acidobacteriaceae bacterium]|nr:MFS transporter [Acidobacteriaceae bacterium]